MKKVSKIASSLPLISKITSVLVGRDIDTVEKVEQFIDGGIESLHNPYLKKIYKAKKLDREIVIKEFFENNLDLCLLGIVADSMPLIDENRIIVKMDLKIMEKSSCKTGSWPFA
ncbi:MAG: hypothetical protein LE168_02860 [Endomicrobium sp.]|nr:hypothetical protein [Endomicrobium sp.]